MLERVADRWIACDDGLSRHGTKVNGEPLAGRRRLEHGDILTLGETPIVFLAAAEDTDAYTTSGPGEAAPQLAATDRHLLDVLCEPLLDDAYASPASNRDIAGALFPVGAPGQGAHRRAVRALRRDRPAAEPQARRPRRPRVADGPRPTTRAGRVALGPPWSSAAPRSQAGPTA